MTEHGFKQKIVLVDNGSRRPAAVLNLGRLARQLSEVSGQSIDAVPLQHADKIPPEDFGDYPGVNTVITFPEYVKRAISKGLDELIIIPLFFGHSRALTSFIPDTINSLKTTHGTLNWSIAEVLCPLPRGEPKLARLLYDNLSILKGTNVPEPDVIILVDHGSPSRKVTDVRVKLAAQLSPYLSENIPLLQASMERRKGPEYDFCGPLLNDLLDELAHKNTRVNVTISMLFLSPGRHAGEGGDIADICDQAMQKHPGLRIQISPLVGDNPLLIELLHDRLKTMV